MSETRHSLDIFTGRCERCGAQAAECDAGTAWRFPGPCRTEADRRREAEERACAGIPTEALEAGALAKALEATVSVVRILRGAGDEEHKADVAFEMLLAALRALGRLP